MMASWVKQMEEVLHRWIQTQNQWWDDYFAVLRRGGLTPPDQFDAPPATVAESVSTVTQPAAVLEPLATVASPSAVSEPVIIPKPLRQQRCLNRYPSLHRWQGSPTTSSSSMASALLWKRS